jgi:TonB family protein
MDAVGEVLAEKEKEAFPWAAGASLAAALHLGLLGAFFASSLARPLSLTPPRAVAVRILSAGSIRTAQPAKSVAAAPEPVKPKIEKPPEEAPPPPPSEKAVLLPAKEEKKKKPTPAPVTAPRATTAPAPDVSLPSSAAEGSGTGPASAAGAGGNAGIGSAQLDQPDFRYPYYIESVVAALSTNWFKPTPVIQTPPVVHFRIQRDGTVADPEIVRSSGLPYVDRAALRAVLASTFPPLPPDWTGPHVGLRVTFE